MMIVKRLFIVCTFLSLILFGFFLAKQVYLQPWQIVEKSVKIPQNSSGKQIAQQLHEAGIIQYPRLFYAYLRLFENTAQLKPGSYGFYQNAPFVDIVQKLQKGHVQLFSITFPEGYSLQDMANSLNAQGFVDKHAFLQLAFDPNFAAKMNIPNQSLEGYLFPDTYKFEKPSSAETILLSMLNNFSEHLKQLHRQKAKVLKLDLNQWVTLASIIEKESSNLAEQPIISSVFHNRLKKNMRLQTDPTVIYGIKNFDGNITKKHLRTPHPYNTYTMKGLPPGPIANPGLSSLKAAINPSKTDYLYFVAKGRTGKHYFSKTYRQHNKAVRYYQLGKGKKP